MKRSARKLTRRITAAVTAFAFLSLQLFAPTAGAEENPLPRWLREENGGWVPADRAQRMNRADQELLAHLSALEQAQQRFVTTHPSGLQTLFVRPEPVEGQTAEAVVARDSAGNLLWAPALDDYQKVQNGTLLLVDGTLQVVKNGQMVRQVDVMGNEALFRADGRVDHETAADGTRTDYVYSESGFTRTIHNPDGDVAQEYNAEGRLVRETLPGGKVSTYSNGILATVTAGGFLYTYSARTENDGTITATLSEVRAADGAVYTLSNGDLAAVRLPDGTQQKITAGAVSDVLLPDGRAFRYDSGWLRQLKNGAMLSNYSYTFGAGGNVTSITVTAADGSSRVYSAAGALQGLTDPDATRWTVVNGLITQSVSPAGALTTLTRLNTPYGQHLVRQSGTLTDRFSFDAAGKLFAAGTDRNLSGPTPFTTPLQSFSAGTLSNAGIIATDGKYLYVKPFSSSNKTFTKVGTGFGGTVAGQVYGTLTGSVSNTISATFYSDGFLYQPDPATPTRVEQINPATGAKVFVTVPAGFLRLDTATATAGQILITSDGRYLYNLSYHQTRNSTTLNGWTVRVFDPKNGWALVKQFTAGTTSFKANGLMSDGTFLYAVEWTNSNSARVAVIRISDAALTQTWTANQGTTNVVNGQYDWVNQRFWMGAKSSAKVYAYDDPNDLPFSAWVEREGLRAPIAQTQLADMDRLPQPVNAALPDLSNRIARDLPGATLTYNGPPPAKKTGWLDGLWNQASWPITVDALPPTGSMELPALTDQREITLSLNALDPAASDGTTGSGVRMMRFSTDGGKSWSDPEPFAASKTLTLPEQDGDYTIEAQFQDAAGQWSEPAARTVTLDALPPVLALASPDTTDQELYDFLFSADGLNQAAQRWRLGRGRHLLIATAANQFGKTSWARMLVTRTGELPAVTDPGPLPEGATLTQTLNDGSVATYVAGRLVQVTTPDGTTLLHPTLDDAGAITGGWLIAPDGTTTFLQASAVLWVKTPLGAVYWYSPEQWLEAVRGVDGTITAYAYQFNEAGDLSATLISTAQESLLISPDGQILQRVGADGLPLPLEEAALPQAALALLQDAQGKITGLSAERDGITRTYNAAGQLSSVTLSDRTRLTFQNGELTQVALPDGAQITDGVYDAASRLISGTVTLADGRVIRYAGGRPVEATLPDGSKVGYTDGQPTGLTMPDESSYVIARSPPEADDEAISWVATVIPAEAGIDPRFREDDSLTELIYSEDWVLQRATRADGAHLTYVRPEPVEGRAVSRLSTLTQAGGTVISYAYDSAGRLANTVASSPNAGEPVIRTEYAYDKIRKVYKGEELLYDYAYEFQPDGAEITVIREVPTGLIKRYRAGLLISQTDPDGAVTTYEYASDPAGYSDPLDTAIEAIRTLSDGTLVHYQRVAGSWAPVRLTLPEGHQLLLTGGRITEIIYPDGRVETEVDATNLVDGYASLEGWSNGPAHSPDGWDPGVDIGATITQETSSENVHSGTSSVRLSTGSGGGDSALFRNIVPFGDKQALAKYEGRTVTLGAWVKTDDPQAALAVVLDDVMGAALSTTHPGDGQWHFLTTTQTVGRDILKLQAWLMVRGVDKTAYFDDAVFVVGPAVLMQDFSSILEEAALPFDPASLRRMVDQGTLALIQPVIASSKAVKQTSTLARAAVSYQGKPRETFTYHYSGGLTRVTDEAGVIRTYDATNRLVVVEQPDGTRYDVSYDRDLSESQILRIAGLHTDDPELLKILKNPEGDRIVTHRLTRLALSDGSQITADFPPETLLEQEFDASGNLISRTQANGQVTLYDHNQPTRTYDLQGNLITTFSYDSTGRLVKITLVAARREMAAQIDQLKTDIPRRRSQALEDLARQRGIVIDQVQTQFSSTRSQLQNQLSTLNSQLSSLENTNVRGRSARRQKSQAMDQIRAAMNQVRDAQTGLEAQYAQSLGQLESQVESVRRQIETESGKAMSEIESRSAEFHQQILRQEISSIVISTYRSTVGRDPSDQEFQQEVQRLYDRYGADPAAALDLTDLTQRIQALPDYSSRAGQVAAIKQQVTAWLAHYASLRGSKATEAISALGLTPDQIVSLSSADINRILAWLNSRSLHFGHSAFLALQEYLAAQGIQADPVSIAVQAILTDILIGVINPKVNSSADLEISLFTLAKLARRSGAGAVPAHVSFQELGQILSAGPAIAHVNGNHYIVLLSIAADGTVTYREPNTGPAGETLTMTQADFQKIWEGNVLSARAPPHLWQVLTDREAQRITGSFFGLIFLGLVYVFRNQIASVLDRIAIFIQDYIPQWLSPASSLVSTTLTSFSNILKGQNIKESFLNLAKVALTVVLAVINPVGFAIGLATSTVLQAAGVNQTISSLVSAFASGGITGGLAAAGNAAMTFAQSVGQGIATAIQSTAIAGTQLGLVKAGLDPGLASIAGIGVGTMVGALTQGVDIQGTTSTGATVTWHATGFEALGHVVSTQLVPTLAGELAFYGVQKLGQSIGLDPRISQLAGITLSTGIRNITNSGNPAQNVLKAMGQGLREGATNLAFSFLGEQAGLDPLPTALLSRTLTAAYLGTANPNTTIFQEVGKAFWESTGNAFTLGAGNGNLSTMTPYERAVYLSKINDFSSIVRERGITEALEIYAASIFQRDAVEEIWRLGGVADLLTKRATFEDLEIKQLKFGADGKPLLDARGQPIEEITHLPVKRIQINGQNELYLSSLNDDIPIALREGNRFSIGHFAVAPDGRFLMTNGRIEVDLGSGAKGTVLVINGQAVGTYFDDNAKRVLSQYATSDRGIFFDNKNEIWDGKVEIPSTGVVLEFEAGKVVRFSAPSVDGAVSSELLTHGASQLSAQEIQNVMQFLTINGVANRNMENIPPEYMEGFKNTLAKVLDVDASKIFVLPVYEQGNFVKDGMSWLFDFLGTDLITNEVIAKMDAEIAARGGQGDGMVVVAYSGGFQPLLKAIEKRGYNVETIVAVGTPAFKGTINAPQVKRIINVSGENDLFNPIIRESFKRPNGDAVEVINIELKGVSHAGPKGYFATPTDVANDPQLQALNVRASEFIARVTQRSEDPDKLKAFLDPFFKDGKYVVDLQAITF